jgi:hypothetical protein
MEEHDETRQMEDGNRGLADGVGVGHKSVDFTHVPQLD